jgi:Ca-activated chloride channel family protein
VTVRGVFLVIGLVATTAVVSTGASGQAPATQQAPPVVAPPQQQTPPPAQQPPAQQPPAASFRSGVDVVSLTITATDATGHYVRDLNEPDFEVYEDGTRQDISFFTKTTLPLAVSLLLDTSASMEDKMGTVQIAASGFVAQMRSEDQAQLIDFDNKVNITIPFSGDKAALDRGIRATAPGGSTALYNAIYIALKELKKVQAKAGSDLRRQAIVVLTDGEDTSSLVSFEEVLELAKRSETAIYAIGLKSKDYVTTKGYNEADFVLNQLTTQTGGRVFFPAKLDELPGIYRTISEELSSQYSLGYTSKNPKRDSQWRRVVVKIARTGVNARTKQGYYAPGL